MKTSQLASKCLFLLLFLAAAFESKAQSADAILGTWYNTEKTAQVEIEKSGCDAMLHQKG